MRPTRNPYSLTLILGALVLLASIMVGNHLGDSVLGQFASRGGGGALPPGELPTPVAQPVDSEAPLEKNWKRLQIMSVATDPGFPDPRITPAPTATPAPPVAPRASSTPRPAATNRAGVIPGWKFGPPPTREASPPPAFPEDSITTPPYAEPT